MSPRGLLSIPVGRAFEKLSEFLTAKPKPPNRALPICPSQFSAIPIDTVEEILLQLPGQDILRMKQVCWDDASANV